MLGEFVKQIVVVEAAHLDNSVDELARAVESEAAIRLAGDSVNHKIDLWRRAPVKGELDLAET